MIFLIQCSQTMMYLLVREYSISMFTIISKLNFIRFECERLNSPIELILNLYIQLFVGYLYL